MKVFRMKNWDPKQWFVFALVCLLIAIVAAFCILWFGLYGTELLNDTPDYILPAVIGGNAL